MKQAKPKKHVNRSDVSVRSTRSAERSNTRLKDNDLPQLDVLMVKVLDLQLFEDDPRQYIVKITFFDQLIVSSVIKPWYGRNPLDSNNRTHTVGNFNFDPSDYEKITLFADVPLIVYIKPLKDSAVILGDGQLNTPITTHSNSSANISSVPTSDISSCNIDILPIFIDNYEMCVKKRMEQTSNPSVLYRKSWETLPLLTLKLTVVRHPDNEVHHEFLKRANYMKIILVGAFNLPIPHEDTCNYLAGTKLPQHNEMNSSVVLFQRGYRKPKRLDPLSFYPVWENLRGSHSQELFNSHDEKLVHTYNILNEHNLNLPSYLRDHNSTIWASFHRNLLMEDKVKWLSNQFRDWQWPFELQVYYDNTLCFNFMAFLDCSLLLYPGENEICMAVPLQKMNAVAMRETCGCDVVLTPPSTSAQKSKTPPGFSIPSSPSTESGYFKSTEGEEMPPFVVLKVKLARPLIKIIIPPVIPDLEIQQMLEEIETHGRVKRECTGRGQLLRDWQATVRTAANALRKVPHYGMMEFCLFNRQLSETRTRVELSTSFWMDAAIYVNNNFNIKDFLFSEDQYQEMIMMSHAVLMRTTFDTLVGVERWKNMNPILRAARHSRHLQDISHALEHYLVLTSEKPYDSNNWRELSTCLRDVDPTWANVCIDKALQLDMRHPLNLLIKSCTVYEEDRDAAEPFFLALLAAYPFWSTAWVIASVYFLQRELFLMSDQILECLRLTQEQHLVQDVHLPRSWEHELGDWWDSTPILPGMSCYYDAADLLLRIRAIELAEACLALALADGGAMAAYFHLVALCCRLQGKIDDAICILKKGTDKYGDLNYLKSLEAECHHKNKNIDLALDAFQKVINPSSTYSILLSLPIDDDQRARSMIVDLLRRQPNAYGWLALAENWLMVRLLDKKLLEKAGVGCGGDGYLTEEQTAAITCAVAYAIQALKYDRRAGRAWALLSQFVKPSARRLYCTNMAIGCGYVFPDSNDKVDTMSGSRQSLCYRLGWALMECGCEMCCHLSF